MYLSTTYARVAGRAWRIAAATGIGAAAASVALAAGGAGSATAFTPAHAASARHSGTVDVLSAGSLDTLMTKSIGPAFHRATGYTLDDISGGSSTLAADIRNRVDVADVFVSASPIVDRSLKGSRNGNWLQWYAEFAYSPYVLAYNPHSRFAKDIRTMPWYKVITLPGFRLGRTDPSQDPGGVLAVEALRQTATKRHLPALDRIASDSSNEYPETTEQAGIQNGQLDAAFMYEADANSQHSPFVSLTGTNLYGLYTFSQLNRAPHVAAAQAFIRFLVSREGRALFHADRFGTITPPKVLGTGVPSALKGLFK